MSPLHLAAKCGHVDVCRLLVEKSANLDLKDGVCIKVMITKQVKRHEM